MKKLLVFWYLAAVFSALAVETPILTVTRDRANGLYKKGEMAAFVIRLEQGGESVEGKEVNWTILKNGLVPVASGTASLTNGVSTISAKLDEAGFLLCEVTVTTEDKPLKGLSGAAYEPMEIKPSKDAPKDFDAFWKEQLSRLAAVPQNYKLTPVPSSTSGVEAYDLQADAVGSPVSGYFAKPTGAKKGSQPAILTLHGAGVNSARLESVIKWAEKGLISLDINAHGLPNNESEKYYKNLAENELRDYRVRGRIKRDDVYFLGMFQRVVRALDFLASRPEWDGRTLIVYGSSQGGAQALAGAALDNRVTFFVAGVPAMCDHNGRLTGRDPGWPKFIPVNAAEESAVRDVAGYFDMVNFASRIKAPGFFTVGFLDTTCPPATVYAAYNQLGGEKSIFDDVSAGHVNTPEAQRLMQKAVLDHVASQKKP